MAEQSDREALIARASWWAGRCTDGDLTVHEYADLSAFLIDVKNRMAMDRPRMVKTVDQLEDMPEGSVVMEDGSAGRMWVFQKNADDAWELTGSQHEYVERELNLPATVLFEPEEAE